MNKFYNPKLHKAAPVAPVAFAQYGVAPPPPPETFGAYGKKGEESGGVIAMMDMMVADLDKEITEIEVGEKNAQEEYSRGSVHLPSWWNDSSSPPFAKLRP